MRYGKCIACKKIEKLTCGEICSICAEGLKKSFHYYIGGKKVSREKYNHIVKRGYVIPEELDEDRK